MFWLCPNKLFHICGFWFFGGCFKCFYNFRTWLAGVYTWSVCFCKFDNFRCWKVPKVGKTVPDCVDRRRKMCSLLNIWQHAKAQDSRQQCPRHFKVPKSKIDMNVASCTHWTIAGWGIADETSWLPIEDWVVPDLVFWASTDTQHELDTCAQYLLDGHLAAQHINWLCWQY